MRSLGSTAASPSSPAARQMRRASISRPRWRCPPARMPVPAMQRAPNSPNWRAPSRPGSPRQGGRDIWSCVRRCNPLPLWERVARREAARRVRGISPRVSLLQLNSRKQPLIRRFAPPSPTRGEGRKKSLLLGFGLLRLLHRLLLGGLLLHLHRDRCAGGNPHRPRVAVGDVVGGHLQALGGGDGLLHGGFGHHLEAVAGLLALGLGRKPFESIPPLLGAGHQARMQLSGQLPDHDIQVGVRHVVLSSSKTISMRADYADRALPWQFPAARHPQLPVTKTKKPRYARGSLAWFGVFCLTSARRPGRLSLPDRGRSRTRPPDICNSPAASP